MELGGLSPPLRPAGQLGQKGTFAPESARERTNPRRRLRHRTSHRRSPRSLAARSRCGYRSFSKHGELCARASEVIRIACNSSGLRLPALALHKHFRRDRQHFCVPLGSRPRLFICKLTSRADPWRLSRSSMRGRPERKAPSRPRRCVIGDAEVRAVLRWI